MKKNNFIICFLMSLNLYASWSCSNSKNDSVSEPTIVNSPPVKITIEPTVIYQTISGFGGANRMWGSESLSIADAQKAFGQSNNELGLSIFRVRLPSDKSEWPIIIESVKEANKFGVKVLACPWSPPASLKSNNSLVGGFLLPENYKKFKDYINEFITYMSSNGAKIDVVSIQNEPDWKPTYESCDYSADDFINFFNAPGQIVGAKVAAPESLNFNQTLTNTILSNIESSSKIDIIAGHTYGGGTAKFPLAEQKNKEIWMTEYLLNLNSGNTGAASWNSYSESSKWLETMKMLTGIHEAMTSNWNAYIWWYLKRFYSFIGDGEQGTINGEILKRGYAYSHFSKFIRPGFVRINSSVPADSSLKITAYKKDTQTVIVVINNEIYAINNIQINSENAKSSVSYMSSLTSSLLKKDLSITNGKVTFDIPENSVVTIILNN